MFGAAFDPLLTFLAFNAPGVTALYALTLALPLLYWWARVWRESRQERTPRHAWWSVPGLLLLLFAPIQEQPTFFALGAFALLFAEYWPRAYRSASTRPGWIWPTLGLGLGLLLLISAVYTGGTQKLVFVVALALLLVGMAALISALAWPIRRPAAPVNVWPRWANATVPEWPDLSVTLTAQGAELKNVSTRPLALSGWSPARLNGWLLVRDLHGQPLHTLSVGQTAFLPLGEQMDGIRVWYMPADDGQGQVRLFRADWTPQRYQQGRVLN